MPNIGTVNRLHQLQRFRHRIVDLKQVNRVLIQPHWRKDCDIPTAPAFAVLAIKP